MVAHTTQLRDFIFRVRCLCSRLFGTFFILARKTSKKGIALPAWLSTYMAAAVKIPIISQVRGVLFWFLILLCKRGPFNWCV